MQTGRSSPPLYQPAHAFVSCRQGRVWLVGLLAACFLWFSTLSVLHHHRDEASEAACVTCHVLHHQTLDLPEASPALALVPVGLLCLLVLGAVRPAARVRAVSCHPSRAPPRSDVA